MRQRSNYEAFFFRFRDFRLCALWRFLITLVSGLLYTAFVKPGAISMAIAIRSVVMASGGRFRPVG